MENNRIKSIGDLRSEIIRLQADVDEHEALIQQDFNEMAEQIRAPFQFVKKIGSWFGGAETDHEETSADWFTLVAKLGFPYLMNKFFFKRSGIIMKALVALASQKAAEGLNFSTVSSWIEQLSSWVKKRNQKKETKHDYGIPPDSESF
ncbi:MAG: hypothetical protein ACKOW2_08140 [Sphingobacteriaceae bacterium]